ncbi:hypothetical protein M9Y10_022513 [Tritrichomonas musculus]|uniref:SDE2-like domain-containing protein n=1 Tax=Tritrichomonas musculus TaxID=1915356 RepID=A0ABR2KTG0_9EUKA
MSKLFLSFQGKTYILSQEESLNPSEYVAKKFGFSKDEFFFSGQSPFLHLSLRLDGGKGGFGRAMLQEGQRRSRRLPEHKDACRTLSGKRIGFIKAKRRVVELRAKIKELEEKKAEEKATIRRTNKVKELENIQNKEIQINESISSAVRFGIDNITENKETAQESKTVENDSDFEMLFEE